MNMVDRLAGASSSLAFKAPCRVATTTNITLSGLQAIDGVTPTVSEHPDLRRILVKNQNLPAENGIYVCDTGPWLRALDFDSVVDFREGTRVYVYEGSTQFGAYVVSSDMDPETFEIDADNIVFTTAAASDLASLLTTRGDLVVRGASAVQRLALGTSGYHLQSDGTDAGWAGFLQSGTGTATRTWQDKARDLVSLKDWGAVGDGTTDDTTAVTNADADTRAKFAPPGIYHTTIGPTDLDGPYWGFGQIRDSGNNLRAPWANHLKAAPSSLGDHDSILTAFNGDISGIQIAMEHWVSGAATLGQPATGYEIDPETSPIYINAFNTSGHNQSTSGNDGRTGSAMLHLKYHHDGQGDYGGIFVNGLVSGSKPGATSFLASPAGAVIYGQVFAAASSAYLNIIELNSVDNGFQAAAVGVVFNFDRTVATATLGEVWMGFRPQSIGSQAADVIYSGAGSWKRGLDLTAVTFDASKAAITLKADDRIYGDASASGDVAWGQTLGSTYITYASSISAWNVVVAGTSAFQMYANQAGVNGKFFPITDDGGALGDAAHRWSDLFLAPGGVIDFGNGDVTVTHSANTLTVSGGVLAAPINLFTQASVNFNSANSDTSLTIALPSGYTRYRISNVVISGASASLTTATFGLFTASGGGGTAIIAGGTAITVSTASEGTANNMQTTSPTPVNQNIQSFNNATLFFRVGTAQGSAATATVTISYSPVS